MNNSTGSTNKSTLSSSKGTDKTSSINRKGIERFKSRRKSLSVTDYVEGIKAGDLTILSQAITLIESKKATHRGVAQDIIEQCLSANGNSIRIGITGVPGVGKSTFIEALGNHLIKHGHKLAVLAIDPSSSRSKGSILGDKTRMQSLSTSEQAFIRPSPTGGTLGGVARKTRESIFLCEAAGFDTIFVETVGVGQSETTVHSMVDFFLLLMLAGAGDELQGIKRGIMEMADTIAINKTDDTDPKLVQRTVREYKNAMHLYPEKKSGWQPQVTTCSAFTGEGIPQLWKLINEYASQARDNGYFQSKRNHQSKHWMHDTISTRLKDHFYGHPEVREECKKIEEQVLRGELSSSKAAEQLLELYFNSL